MTDYNVATSKFDCKYCDVVIRYKKDYECHVTMKTYGIPFSCMDCNFKSCSKLGLALHVNREHNNDQYDDNEEERKCKYCLIQFKNDKDFEDHKLMSTYGAPKSCGICSFKSCSREILADHEKKTHTTEDKEDIDTNKSSYLKCKYCNMTTMAKANMKFHQSMNSYGSPKSCDLCSYKSCSKKGLENHFKKAHSIRNDLNTVVEKSLSCEYCDLNFSRKTDLNVHKATISYGAPKPCQLCSFKSCSIVGLTRHASREHGHKTVKKRSGIKCKHCDVVSSDKQNYLTHTMSLKYGAPRTCSQCQFKSCTKRGLVNHTKKVHLKVLSSSKESEIPDAPEITDDIPDIPDFAQAFNTLDLLNDPARKQESQNQDENETLPKKPDNENQSTTSSEELSTHNCKHCDMVFEYRSNLNFHMNTLTYGAPKACKSCTFKACTVLGLRSHEKRAHRETKDDNNYSKKPKLDLNIASENTDPRKDLKCIYCDAEFFGLKKMIVHQGLDTYGAPKSCQICDFKSCSRLGLKRHVFKIHETKDYLDRQCKFCDMKFFSEKDVEQHQNISTYGSPMSCEKCQYKCCSNTGLKLHIKKAHLEADLCDHCDVDFHGFLSRRLRHKKMPTYGSPLTCSQCPYKSCSTVGIGIHKLKHRNTDSQPKLVEVLEKRATIKNVYPKPLKGHWIVPLYRIA